MSSCDARLPGPLKPYFLTHADDPEPCETRTILDALQLERHLEGGYFVQTDKDSRQVPNPFRGSQFQDNQNYEDETRSASTTIYYMITPNNPLGVFHRNKARTVHTLHSGRGRYVIIHADEATGNTNARIESFVVGHNVAAGERLQWIVEGGKYKSSFLLPDHNDTDTSKGLLISETVVPGFEYSDHDFMTRDRMQELVTARQMEELQWMLHPSQRSLDRQA